MGKKERTAKLISAMVSATLATGMVPAAAFAQEAVEGAPTPDQGVESVDPTATEIAKAAEGGQALDTSAASAIALQDNGGDQPAQTAETVKLDLANGSIVITETGYVQGNNPEVSHTGDYEISGKTTINNIIVEGGTHVITLKDVSVDVRGQTGEAACACAIKGGDVTLSLPSGLRNAFTSGNSATSEPNNSEEWNNATSYAGIEVDDGASLTIEGEGSLTANSDSKRTAVADPGTGAGIGASATCSNGKWSKNANGCGDITISGGTVVASSTNGPGIGGGKSAAKVAINGGDVTATGGGFGCGIGSCYSNEGAISIEIDDGIVVAKATGNGAGIGGPIYKNNNCPVTIKGGDVTAIGGGTGAGIGSGGSSSSSPSSFAGNGGDIAITGGFVRAQGGTATRSDGDYVPGGAAGIGGGYSANKRNTVGAGMGSISITGGVVEATGGSGAPGIGTSSLAAKATNAYDIGSLVITGANVKAVAGEDYDPEGDYAVKVLKAPEGCGIGLGRNASDSAASKFADWSIDAGDGTPMEVVSLSGQSGNVPIARNGDSWHSFAPDSKGVITLYCPEGYYDPASGEGFLVAPEKDKLEANALVRDLNAVDVTAEGATTTVAALDARFAAMSAAQQSYINAKVEQGHQMGELKESFKTTHPDTTVTLSCESGDELNGKTATVKYWQAGYDLGKPASAPQNYVFDGWFVGDTRVTDDSGKSSATWPYLGDVTATAHWRSEITGAGEENDPYVIQSGSNLVALSHISNNIGTPEELALFGGATSASDLLSRSFKLGNDVTLSNTKDVAYVDRFYSIVGFGGTFDGDGKTINLDVDTSELAECSGDNSGKVNIAPEGADAQYLQIFGGIFSTINGATIENVKTAGAVKLLIAGGSAGVLAGVATGPVTFVNCTNDASLEVGSTVNTNWAGGLAGQVGSNGSTDTATFKGCENHGNVAAGTSLGASLGNSCSAGIASLIFAQNIVFEDCSNSGNLTATRATDVAERYSSVSGIAGLCYTGCKTLSMTNCSNSGALRSEAQRANTAYGLAGVSGSMDSVSLTGCSNSGSVVAEGGTAYVLVGGHALDSVSMPPTSYTNCSQILGGKGDYSRYSFNGVSADYSSGTSTLRVPVEKDSDNSFDASRYVCVDGKKAADLVSMGNSEVYNDFSHNGNQPIRVFITARFLPQLARH